MKKTLLAVAALAAAGSVNAAEVYNNEGSTLDINGRAFAIMQVEDSGAGSESSISDGGSRLGFTAKHQATEGVAAIGRFEVEYSGAQATKAGTTDEEINIAFSSRDFYAGLEFTNIGTLTFGRQTTIFDDAAFRGGFDEWYGYSQQLADRGRDNGIVKFSANKLVENLTAGVTYQFAQDDNKHRSGFTIAGAYDLPMGLGLSAGFYDYADEVYAGRATEANYSGFNLGASYKINAMKFGADFSMEDQDGTDVTAWRIGGEYNLNAARIYGGYGEVDADEADKESGFYAGVGYALGSKTTVFVEYSQKDTATDFSGATAGIVVNF
ncbi:porin [Vibrio nigripulchritudo]|uniref:porin n=1 Tax=Vibrio nigripulchritudo TaxID=28173 RepID=UPI0024921918|nr:porin [Vibrio nigripulchritudo]BDU40017.1 outer membrane protein [Vibrio nigripulchritudo]BDU45741.1 outer membrane protein [Vibrio nigripulchritudo]